MGAAPKSSSHFGRWLWAGLVTIVVLWFAQQIILKPVIEAVSSKVIGARVTLGSFSLNILTQQVHLTDVKIYNEEGFPPKLFFNASEILVDINIFAAMKGKISCPLVVFRLDKMIVFKNAKGKLNVDELKIVQEKLHEKNKGPMPNFKIDVLKLNIEQVIVEDDSKTPPVIEAYDLNLKDKTILNVNSVPKLVGLVLFEALKPTAIQSAGMYAATTLLGVGFLPGLVIGVAVANDKAVSDMPHSFDQVYQRILQLVQSLGQVKHEDHSAGKITAKVYGCDITIEVQDQGWEKSKITIKARKYYLPKPEIAAGLLYQLKEELK
jgi:hypothetical protein